MMGKLVLIHGSGRNSVFKVGQNSVVFIIAGDYTICHRKGVSRKNGYFIL